MRQKKLKSEIFELLSTFSSQELKRFGEFLNSPFHNKSRKLIKIYSFIKKFHPDFCEERLTLESIHKSWKPDEEFHAPNVRVDLSHLLRLALRFISIEVLCSKTQNSYGYILNELNKRNLPNLFDKMSLNIQPVLEGKSGWNIDLMLERFKVNSQRFNRVDVTVDKTGEGKRTSRDAQLINDVFVDLSSYYISRLINCFVVLTTNKIAYGVTTDDSIVMNFLKSNIMTFYRNMSKNVNPLLSLKLICFDAFDNFENDTFYKQLTKSYETLNKYLDPETSNEIYYTLLSYCSLKRMKGVKLKYYDNQLLRLYDLMLENKYHKYKYNEFIPLTEFRNMIVISIGLEKYIWTLNLLNNHLNELRKDYREPMLNLGHAYISFYLKNYDDTLNYVNKIKKDLMFFRFDIYNFKIKIFYEKKDYDFVLNMIKSYVKTIESSLMLNSLRKERTRNFISAVKALCEIRLGRYFDSAHILRIRNLLEKSSDQAWVSQKLEEIIKERSRK